ncbi:hypothetical protein JTB14_013279 [Gonioctena quinquepunctata]|nr:hypothetical protein JTB14_013279 [Gonioctena quinquepunctata]
MEADIYRIDNVEEMKIPEQTYEHKEFERTFNKVCRFKYHKFHMIDNNYDTYHYQYLKNALIHKAKRGNDEESKTKLENIRGQELVWRKQRLYMALSWMIDVIEGKTRNYMNESETFSREFEVQYKLLEESSPEHWTNFLRKVSHLQGYEKPGRRSESYQKYVEEKLEDKDKGSKSNANSDVNTPPPLSAGNKADNSAGNAPSAFTKKEIEDMEWRMMLLATREVKFSLIIGDEIT